MTYGWLDWWMTIDDYNDLSALIIPEDMFSDKSYTYRQAISLVCEAVGRQLLIGARNGYIKMRKIEYPLSIDQPIPADRIALNTFDLAEYSCIKPDALVVKNLENATLKYEAVSPSHREYYISGNPFVTDANATTYALVPDIHS